MTDRPTHEPGSEGELLDGRYRLGELLGEGAMARVYRADDTHLHRVIAIKLLRGALDDLGSVERAQTETRLLASLNHPALVTLYDARISPAGGVSYLVMEYVEGVTLRERILEGPLTSAEAAALTLDIAEALHVAHGAGIVHRDIKPSNVLLWKLPVAGREWRAKLADFGIAYLLDSTRLTLPGVTVGTMAYIAPEQARGEAPAPPADIYSLGIMLIEALTSERPFADAEGFGTVMARLVDPPSVPETLDPAWQQLLRGMTALRPEDRPTALEVAEAASRITRGEVAPATSEDESTVALAAPAAAGIAGGAAALTGGAHPATGPTMAFPAAAASKPTDTRRRRRPVIIGVLSGVAALAVALGAVIWSSNLGDGTPDPAETTPATVATSTVETPASTTVETPVEPAVVNPAPAVDPEEADDKPGNSGNDKDDKKDDAPGGKDKGPGGGKDK